MPIFMIIFTLLGFVAGIRTMLTAKEVQKDQEQRLSEKMRGYIIGTRKLQKIRWACVSSNGSVYCRTVVWTKVQYWYTVTMLLCDGVNCCCSCFTYVGGNLKRALVPGRALSVSELAYGFVQMVEDVAGRDAVPYFRTS